MKKPDIMWKNVQRNNKFRLAIAKFSEETICESIKHF